VLWLTNSRAPISAFVRPSRASRAICSSWGVRSSRVSTRRAVGRYSVGRIVNPRTARAQMLGGIVWGWGKATMEASRQDERLGRWLSKNLAGVALPVNADIPTDIDVAFIDEVDEHASPIGGKGIGELGATGVDAAVADAVFHATGRPVRELPITPEKLV
jgi:xanthine dehydrogenase YagR molybdenum-binding subunit